MGGTKELCFEIFCPDFVVLDCGLVFDIPVCTCWHRLYILYYCIGAVFEFDILWGFFIV